MRLLTFAFSILSVGTAFAQDPLFEADSLVKLKKYDSAFNLLHDLPNSNSKPNIVLKKVDIAMEYFVQSLMHRMFAFKDLEEGESISDYRGTEGDFPMYLFPIDSILQNLIITYPNNGKLYKALADYYYDVSSRYKDKWFLTPEILQDRTKSNYLRAEELRSSDYLSLHNLAVIYLREKNLDKASTLLRRSLKLKPEFPSSNYNLSYVLLSKKQFKEALPFAQKAFNNYDDHTLKADAAQLMGVSSEGLGKNGDAIKFYQIAHELNPDNYFYVSRLFNLYLKSRDFDHSDSLALVLFAYGPHNPNVVKDIIDYYYDHDLQQHVPRMLNLLRGQYTTDHEALGSIFLKLSTYYHKSHEKGPALANLDSSKVHFQQCYKPDHYVFGVIEDARKQILNEK